MNDVSNFWVSIRSFAGVSFEFRQIAAGETNGTQKYSDELMMHHNLCILIIIDAMETARRNDILDRMTSIRSEAEGSLMNCLKFGLNNQFTIAQRHGEALGSSRTFPLVAIDPYPHHAVAGVQLLWKGIERDVDSSNLDRGICEDLQSILLQTLELLPQTSKSIRKATDQARSILN